MSDLAEILGSPLLRRALLEAVIVGVVCGAVGVHVVLRRLPFFAMAVSHGTFPGVVLASLLGINLLAGAWAFAMIIVVVTAALGGIGRLDDTSAIGVILAGSLGLGTLLISTQDGFTRNLAAFLVGSILTVQPVDVAATAAIGFGALAVVAGLHKELVLGAFDPEGAAAMGYRRIALDLALLFCVAAVLAVAVPAVGAILAVALLVAPASAARLWVDRMGSTMVLAAVLGAASGVIGLVASHRWDIAAGGAIVLAAGGLFTASLLLAPRRGRGPAAPRG